ncbi:MAG TPA: ABC transporter substrate-binding protein [Stellaceae bacterium]|nr:ABC transporter substrate-binding protein [Stellaceae bacterium]
MKTDVTRRALLAAMGGTALSAGVVGTARSKDYGPGVTDTEIKLGTTSPYSGPASAYGVYGQAQTAYFQMINEQGGINGRKLEFITLDDGYSPPKAVEQVRKLVEQDEVLLIFQPLGTPSNSAIQQYLNAKKVPQLFVATGASKWGDPQHFPWTMGWQPSYQTEAKIYAKYVLQDKPDAKIGILYQNDDFGKDYLKGIKDGLGDKAAKMIVSEVSYEVTDATVDSQIVTLKGSGADVFFNITTPKFAAQAIRKAYDVDWHPLQLLTNVSISVGSVLTVAGLEKGVGIITADYRKDPVDPQWQDDPAMKEWRAFMAKYYPEGDIKDNSNVYGYTVAQTLVQTLKQCGDTLTRENVMKQAASLDMSPGLLAPGVKINTSATDFYPIKQMRLQKFDGKSWVPFGTAIGS